MLGLKRNQKFLRKPLDALLCRLFFFFFADTRALQHTLWFNHKEGDVVANKKKIVRSFYQLSFSASLSLLESTVTHAKGMARPCISFSWL